MSRSVEHVECTPTGENGQELGVLFCRIVVAFTFGGMVFGALCISGGIFEL